jgi:hypothetical protein
VMRARMRWYKGLVDKGSLKRSCPEVLTSGWELLHAFEDNLR